MRSSASTARSASLAHCPIGRDSRLESPTVEVALAGGVIVDLATKQDQDAHHARLASLLKRPFTLAKRVHGTAPTPGSISRPIVLACGKPPPGFLWVLQWIRTQGIDPQTAVANVNVTLYIGSAAQAPLSIVTLGAGGEDLNAVTGPLAIPSLTTIPDKMVVYPEEDLYGLVIGTAGNLAGAAKYMIVVGVLQLPNTAEALTWV